MLLITYVEVTVVDKYHGVGEGKTGRESSETLMVWIREGIPQV